MANHKTTTTMATIFLAVLFPLVTSQSPSPAPVPFFGAAPGPFMMAPSPSTDCLTYLLNLSDCLTFVEPGSNLTKPDKDCCPELANLVNTKVICLCQLIGNPDQTGFNIDVKKALGLPTVCNVSTPPVRFCAALGVPVGALTPSEAPSPSDGSVAASPVPGLAGDNNGTPSSLASNHFLASFALLLLATFF